jgi:hypothetical protein
MLDAEIDKLLAAHGTSSERLDDGTWRATVATAEEWSYRLFVRTGGGFVRAEVSPFMTLPDDPARTNAVIRDLLRRNRSLAEARFALDDDDTVVIETVVDQNASIDALHSALDALRAAAETNFHALRRI